MTISPCDIVNSYLRLIERSRAGLDYTSGKNVGACEGHAQKNCADGWCQWSCHSAKKAILFFSEGISPLTDLHHNQAGASMCVYVHVCD